MRTRVKFTLVASKSHGHACDQELRLTGSHWGATLLEQNQRNLGCCPGLCRKIWDQCHTLSKNAPTPPLTQQQSTDNKLTLG